MFKPLISIIIYIGLCSKCWDVELSVGILATYEYTDYTDIAFSEAFYTSNVEVSDILE
jgi:hypothetical protein